MSTFARIQNGTVLDVIDFDPSGRFHADIAKLYEPVPDGTLSNAVMVNGQWINPRQPEPPTAEQIAAQQAAEQAEAERQAGETIRRERNKKLTDCDWARLDDTPLDNVAKAQWAAYRQALRDLPDQTGFPFNVIWPNKPE